MNCTARFYITPRINGSCFVVVFLIFLLFVILGFFPEKNCTPCWGYQLFEVEFSAFLHLHSGNPRFSLKFWHTPLEFQLLSLYLPGNFHWYPQQGISIFFWKSPSESLYDEHVLKQRALQEKQLSLGGTKWFRLKKI